VAPRALRQIRALPHPPPQHHCHRERARPLDPTQQLQALFRRRRHPEHRRHGHRLPLGQHSLRFLCRESLPQGDSLHHHALGGRQRRPHLLAHLLVAEFDRRFHLSVDDGHGQYDDRQRRRRAVPHERGGDGDLLDHVRRQDGSHAQQSSFWVADGRPLRNSHFCGRRQRAGGGRTLFFYSYRCPRQVQKWERVRPTPNRSCRRVHFRHKIIVAMSE
jgi:hypothetical protein